MSDTSPDPKPSDIEDVYKILAANFALSGDTILFAKAAARDIAATITTLRASLENATKTSAEELYRHGELLATIEEYKASLGEAEKRADDAVNLFQHGREANDVLAASALNWRTRAEKAEASLVEAEKRADTAERKLSAIAQHESDLSDDEAVS